MSGAPLTDSTAFVTARVAVVHFSLALLSACVEPRRARPPVHQQRTREPSLPRAINNARAAQDDAQPGWGVLRLDTAEDALSAWALDWRAGIADEFIFEDEDADEHAPREPEGAFYLDCGALTQQGASFDDVVAALPTRVVHATAEESVVDVAPHEGGRARLCWATNAAARTQRCAVGPNTPAGSSIPAGDAADDRLTHALRSLAHAGLDLAPIVVTDRFVIVLRSMDERGPREGWVLPTRGEAWRMTGVTAWRVSGDSAWVVTREDSPLRPLATPNTIWRAIEIAPDGTTRTQRHWDRSRADEHAAIGTYRGRLGLLFTVDPLRARGQRHTDWAAIDGSTIERLPSVYVATSPVVCTDAASIAEASILGGVDGAPIWRWESGDPNQGSTFRTGGSGLITLEWTVAGLCIRALEYEGDLLSGRPARLTLRAARSGMLLGVLRRERPRTRDALRCRYEHDETGL